MAPAGAARMPQMSDAEFRMFAELLRAHCGLHFGPETRYLVERRLARRLQELQLRSFTAFHYLLRHDPRGDEELAGVVDSLATNETYFFRERGQLHALVEEILPEMQLRRRERGGGPVSVWSAGCSSGEEPYSIVMLALEAGLDPERDLRVYASDISRPMLKKARAGVYRPSSFRDTEPFLRDKYFQEKDGLFRLSDEVRKRVHFAHLNLMDRSRIALLGSMDAILCRNVIIYFDTETKRKVVRTFRDKLVPGGYLLLGHSESLINLSTEFSLRHLKHEMVYQRPGGSRTRPWNALAEEALESVARAGDEP